MRAEPQGKGRRVQKGDEGSSQRIVGADRQMLERICFLEHEQPRLVGAKAWAQQKERHESKEMTGNQMVP